jgi:succinate dehydrogenase/fumarate reductase cytochrome b subunit
MEIPFSQSFMYGALGSVLFVMVIGVFVLLHHWGYYGIKGNKKIGIKSIFFFGLVLFIMIAITLIALYPTLQ